MNRSLMYKVTSIILKWISVLNKLNKWIDQWLTHKNSHSSPPSGITMYPAERVTEKYPPIHKLTVRRKTETSKSEPRTRTYCCLNVKIQNVLKYHLRLSYTLSAILISVLKMFMNNIPIMCFCKQTYVCL